MSVDLKSLAHKNWPYAGTAHEWRGFVRDEARKEAIERLKDYKGVLGSLTAEQMKLIIELEKASPAKMCGRWPANEGRHYAPVTPINPKHAERMEELKAVYQKQNFGDLS